MEARGDGNCWASSAATAGEKKSGMATWGYGFEEWNAAANCTEHVVRTANYAANARAKRERNLLDSVDPRPKI